MSSYMGWIYNQIEAFISPYRHLTPLRNYWLIVHLLCGDLIIVITFNIHFTIDCINGNVRNQLRKWNEFENISLTMLPMYCVMLRFVCYVIHRVQLLRLRHDVVIAVSAFIYFYFCTTERELILISIGFESSISWIIAESNYKAAPSVVVCLNCVLLFKSSMPFRFCCGAQQLFSSATEFFHKIWSLLMLDFNYQELELPQCSPRNANSNFSREEIQN